MGLEADCEIALDRERGRGRAHLAGNVLTVRGELRFQIPFSKVSAVSAQEGWLDVRFAGRRAQFFLGSAAKRWAEKIRSPKGLMDKLGVTSETRAYLIGISDEGLLREFQDRAKSVSREPTKRGAALVFFEISKRQDLSRLPHLREKLASNGALWVFWPKGQKALREDDIRAFLPGVGLVDVKVVSVSTVLSGLKTVIPLALR
jgi:hypothetical protein